MIHSLPCGQAPSDRLNVKRSDILRVLGVTRSQSQMAFGSFYSLRLAGVEGSAGWCDKSSRRAYLKLNVTPPRLAIFLSKAFCKSDFGHFGTRHESPSKSFWSHGDSFPCLWSCLRYPPLMVKMAVLSRFKPISERENEGPLPSPVLGQESAQIC